VDEISQIFFNAQRIFLVNAV